MTTATFSGTLGGKPVSGTVDERGYQATMEHFTHEPAQVWLLPKSGGYLVQIGPDSKYVIGFIAPITDDPGYWRVCRLDLWETAFATPALAAQALITASRTVTIDPQTGEVPA